MLVHHASWPACFELWWYGRLWASVHDWARPCVHRGQLPLVGEGLPIFVPTDLSRVVIVLVAMAVLAALVLHVLAAVTCHFVICAVWLLTSLLLLTL